jgi:hypothetical protein
MHIKIQIITLREEEMDKACGIYGGKEICIHSFGGKM